MEVTPLSGRRCALETLDWSDLHSHNIAKQHNNLEEVQDAAAMHLLSKLPKQQGLHVQLTEYPTAPAMEEVVVSPALTRPVTVTRAAAREILGGPQLRSSA